MEKLEINEELSDFNQPSPQIMDMIEGKLDELVMLLGKTSLDNNTIQELQGKFSAALRTAASTTAVQQYSKYPRVNNIDEMDGELEQLLFINNLDRKSQRKQSASRGILIVVRLLIALLLILLGFGMIIMPAPPYFEMFTLFYLTPNDGVTIMDVISLIVAFTGVYLLITTIARLKQK